MSKHFKKVKGYYDSGLWSIERVHNAVVKNWITAEEYKIITGSFLGADFYDNNFLILSTASTVLSLSPNEVRRK